MRIEDYGLIGDMESAALVGRDGAVDWLCLPRFDSPACLSALLGDERKGRWLVAPAGGVRATSRRYRPGTLVLETEFETSEGVARVIQHVETIWRQPDDGIWETRGPRRHFTNSKVMAWVVFDRAVIPLVGFLPGTDKRVTGTIAAIVSELGRDGFVSRYSTADTDDGLTGDEGQFLACSFWLVRSLNGRISEARALFERLLGLSNDLGLLAEEFDVERQRQVGNFPQAFSHLTLTHAATAIGAAGTTKVSV